MKLVKALTALKMARSGSEANRMVKEGSVWVGGCIPPCNARMAPYKCVCGGWKKVTNPTEDLEPGTVVRVKDGSWRLLVREGVVKSTGTVFYQVPGIGWVPEEEGDPWRDNRGCLAFASFLKTGLRSTHVGLFPAKKLWKLSNITPPTWPHRWAW